MKKRKICDEELKYFDQSNVQQAEQMIEEKNKKIFFAFEC
jgi:hypothetical protein